MSAPSRLMMSDAGSMHAQGMRFGRVLRRSGYVPATKSLVPAYHHGSEIESLIPRRTCLPLLRGDGHSRTGPRRTRGAVVSVDSSSLPHPLPGVPARRMRWRRWCDEHGLLLLEDAAQAWLATCEGKPAGSFGDLSIICLYKTFGFPDGGALVCANPPASARSDEQEGLAPRFAACSVGRRAVRDSCRRSEADAVRAKSSRHGRRSLSSAIPLRHPRMRSDSSFRESSIEAQRRNVARITICCCRPLRLRTAGLREVRDGASPFAFPLATSEKPKVLERLSSQRHRRVGLLVDSAPQPSSRTNFR